MSEASKYRHDLAEAAEIANEQTRLLNEPCVRCGHVGELLIEQHDGMVCVKCITQDNGEDGEPG